MRSDKACDLCGTILEFVGPGGQRLVFAKHDAAFCADGVRLMHRTHKDVIKQQAMTVGNVLDELERVKAGLLEVLGLIGYNDVDGPRMDALRALAGEP